MSDIPVLLRYALRAKLPEPFCAYCHSPEMLLGIPLEADHIIPTSAGGQTVFSNLVCVAGRATLTKGTRSKPAIHKPDDSSDCFTRIDKDGQPTSHGARTAPTSLVGQLQVEPPPKLYR